MILNKEKINLIKALKTKNIKADDKIKRENIYFQNILKSNIEKYQGSIKHPFKNINENMQNIFSSDESKKKALNFILRHHSKENNNNNANKSSKFTTLNNNNQILLTEPEKNNIIFKDSNLVINNISHINEKKKFNKLENLRNKQNKNIRTKKIIKNFNNKEQNIRAKYTKIEYNKVNKTPINNSKKFSNEIVYKRNANNYLSRNNNNYNSINYSKFNNKTLENNDEYILDDMFYKITKKPKIVRSLNPRKNSTKLYNINNQYKTLNSFYIPKKASAYSINQDNNQLKDTFTKNISDYNKHQTIQYNENNISLLNLYNNRTLDKNNRRKNNINNNYSKRRNNGIRIINNGKSIKEFNISFHEDEDDNEDFQRKKYNKNRFVESYNKYNYIRNMPRININQFNINTNNDNRAYDSEIYDEFLTERNLNNYSNDILNFNEKIFNKYSNDKKYNNSKTIPINDKIKKFKVLIKKRPLKELRMNNISYKKFQSLKYIEDKDDHKKNLVENDVQIDNKRVLNENNLEKISENIAGRDKFNFSIVLSEKNNFTIKSNKKKDLKNKEQNFIKEIANIKQNIIIIKKKEGKILNKIFADENIENINKLLLEQNFSIKDNLIKFIPINFEVENNETKLLEENKKLKIDNELINKNDKMKLELIQKLDKEKQNLLEEIKKLTNENNEQKVKNENLSKENEKLKEENIKLSNSLNELINDEKVKEEIIEIGNIGGLNFNVDIESINEGQI